MSRVLLAVTLAALLAGPALAQQSTGGTTTGTPGNPPATGAAITAKPTHSENSAIGANVPTLPQVALHPGATVGSPVPIAGPGGTTKNATGN